MAYVRHYKKPATMSLRGDPGLFQRPAPNWTAGQWPRSGALAPRPMGYHAASAALRRQLAKSAMVMGPAWMRPVAPPLALYAARAAFWPLLVPLGLYVYFSVTRSYTPSQPEVPAHWQIPGNYVVHTDPNGTWNCRLGNQPPTDWGQRWPRPGSCTTGGNIQLAVGEAAFDTRWHKTQTIDGAHSFSMWHHQVPNPANPGLGYARINWSTVYVKASGANATPQWVPFQPAVPAIPAVSPAVPVYGLLVPPAPVTEVATAPSLAPPLPPYVVPSIDVPIDPPGPPRPGEHVNMPPRNRSREKKLRVMPKWAGMLSRFYGRITEANDMLDCMIKSMPHKMGRNGKWRSPCEGMPQVEKLMCLSDRFASIDVEKFFTCVVEDNATDWAIGQLSRRGAKAYENAVTKGYAPNRPSPAFGGWAGRGAQQGPVRWSFN